MPPGFSLGQLRGDCVTHLHGKQAEACLRVGVNPLAVEFDVPVQLQIQELENAEGESEFSSTWRVTKAMRVDKISQEKGCRKEVFSPLGVEEVRIN